MLSGMGTALGEITLVLFTTLAPSGVVAFILMGLPLLRTGMPADARQRINQFLRIPLVTTMVGLVASATHLGNPANALYVFLGVGRSPLSTEVFCAVVFLALAGVYWLYSFAEQPRVGSRRAAVSGARCWRCRRRPLPRTSCRSGCRAPTCRALRTRSSPPRTSCRTTVS